MPNENEHPRYTDPDHPYSGSGLRYQNNYNRNEYHAGDGPFQFPWWAIVIGFVVWWPLGFIFIGLNAAMKNGKLGSFEQKARTRTQSYRSGPSVQEGQFRPIYAQQDKESAGKTAAAPRDAEKKRKGMALANGLTVAGVLLLLRGGGQPLAAPTSSVCCKKPGLPPGKRGRIGLYYRAYSLKLSFSVTMRL